MRDIIGSNTVVVAVLGSSQGLVLCSTSDLNKFSNNLGTRKYDLQSWVGDFSFLAPGVYRLTLGSDINGLTILQHSRLMNL